MWMYQPREILTGDLSEVNTGKNKGKSYRITSRELRQETYINNEGLDKLRHGTMPLKRSWELTVVFLLKKFIL